MSQTEEEVDWTCDICEWAYSKHSKLRSLNCICVAMSEAEKAATNEQAYPAIFNSHLTNLSNLIRQYQMQRRKEDSKPQVMQITKDKPQVMQYTKEGIR